MNLEEYEEWLAKEICKVVDRRHDAYKEKDFLEESNFHSLYMAYRTAYDKLMEVNE